MTRPSLFIGSSSLGLPFARAVRNQLADDADTTLWNEGIFQLSHSFLESLVYNVERFDFAVLVMTPDDIRTKDGENELQPRDNVVFELGLFMGRLGRERTFVVQQRHTEIKLPSDLLGVATAMYEWPREDNNYTAAVGRACDIVRISILQLGLSERKTEQKLTAVTKEQSEQKSIIKEHQAFFDIVRYSLSEYCFRILWNIANEIEFIFDYSDKYLPGRVWYLHDSGYIEPREPNGYQILDERYHGRDLSKIAKLTPIGNYLVSLRGEPY